MRSIPTSLLASLLLACSGPALPADAGSRDAGPDSGGVTCPTYWRHSVRGGASTDATVSFELERCVELCVAGGCRVQALSFALTYDGATHRATSSQISYSATHHNWTDSLVATLPDRRLRWRTEGGVAVPRELVGAETLEGAVLLPETAVSATER